MNKLTKINQKKMIWIKIFPFWCSQPCTYSEGSRPVRVKKIPFLQKLKLNYCKKVFFFFIHLLARDILVMKKLEIKKTKPTFIISVLKVDIIKVGLVFSISNFFIAKTSLAKNWRSFSSSYLALVILEQ